MNLSILRTCFVALIIYITSINFSFSENINSIEISGNERISKEIIKMFSDVNVGDEIDFNEVNLILKKIYQSNFFEKVDVNFIDNKLTIIVKELPIIQNFKLNGVKAKKIEEKILFNLTLKERSSFNKNFLNEDLKKLQVV